MAPSPKRDRFALTAPPPKEIGVNVPMRPIAFSIINPNTKRPKDPNDKQEATKKEDAKKKPPKEWNPPDLQDWDVSIEAVLYDSFIPGQPRTELGRYFLTYEARWCHGKKHNFVGEMFTHGHYTWHFICREAMFDKPGYVEFEVWYRYKIDKVWTSDTLLLAKFDGPTMQNKRVRVKELGQGEKPATQPYEDRVNATPDRPGGEWSADMPNFFRRNLDLPYAFDPTDPSTWSWQRNSVYFTGTGSEQFRGIVVYYPQFLPEDETSPPTPKEHETNAEEPDSRVLVMQNWQPGFGRTVPPLPSPFRPKDWLLKSLLPKEQEDIDMLLKFFPATVIPHCQQFKSSGPMLPGPQN